MGNVIETIKDRHPLQSYIEWTTGRQWKGTGRWRDLGECPFCSHRDFYFNSESETAFCFCCSAFCGDSIHFRSLYENISYKESIEKFREELGIKKFDKRDMDWVSLREMTCEYLKETLFSCQIKYQFRGRELTPLQYLTEVRQHSMEAILNFRLGFNDGNLVDNLQKDYSKDIIKASGLTIIQNGCFTYPFIVDGEIKYIRIKDPNKLKRTQMPMGTRSKNSIWYNQGVIQDGKELFVVEGEDDVISLWDCGMDAVASCGNLTMTQINYLKTKDLSCIYSAFDSDAGGRKDADLLIRNYENANLFKVKIPENKDIDDLIRDTENRENLIEQLKITAELPSPEMRTAIKQKLDGYYIDKTVRGLTFEKRLTNWTISLEAVIIRHEERIRKVRIKSANYEDTMYIPGVFSSVTKFREFLYNNANRLLYFMGNDFDLSALVQYWEVAFNPKVVKESECVGEIEEGFIADNIFISSANEVKPLTNGFLSLDEKHSIRIVELVRKGGSRSEVPYFPLIEPSGGIESFKKNVFGLMMKNRNLKTAIGVGWLKAVLWSKMFYDKMRFFPLFMIHGKHSSGKTVLANWFMSILGLRDCLPEVLSRGGTSEVGLARKLAYYSSLPVFVDEYGKDEEIASRFHTFFRGIFNRSSGTKGLKDEFGVRRIIIRGCLLIAGEYSPNDAALASRLISIELTKQERNDRYFSDIRAIEPHFACIGLDWLKSRVNTFPSFMAKYEQIEGILAKKIDDPRQASVWAVAVASALTESCFNEDEIIPFASKLANYEIEERRGEEILGTLWQATDILDKKNQLSKQAVNYNSYDKVIQVHLPTLLSDISGSQATSRKYDLPNHREVAKILKQEPYVIEIRNIMVDGKQAQRWVLETEKCPETLKNMFSESQGEPQEELDV